MKRAVTTVVRTAAPRMSMMHANHTEAWHAFGLFGVDFLVDADLKVWLTEVQEGPGLSHLDERVKEDFVPAMVSETTRIGLRAATRLAEGRDLDGIEDGSSFEELGL